MSASATAARGVAAEAAGAFEAPAPWLGDVLSAQAPSGAFPSLVVLDRASGRVVRDENAFVTALVVLHLREIEETLLPGSVVRGELETTIARGLDFIERCRMGEPRRRRPARWGEEVAGAFRFYPEDAAPEWMQTRLAPDVDDTALALSVLVDAGRVSRAEALGVVERVLDPHRVHDPARGARSPWAARGASLTWIDPRAADNPVDATVNANLAALLARLEATDHPAYEASTETVRRAVRWAGSSAEAARVTSPFYPDPAELGAAVERAVRAGVEPFGRLVETLAEQSWSGLGGLEGTAATIGRPVCGSADGRIHWLAPVLHEVRTLARSNHRPRSFTESQRLFREELER